MTARSFNQGIGDCKSGVQRGSIKIAKCHPLQTGAVNSKFTRLSYGISGDGRSSCDFI